MTKCRQNVWKLSEDDPKPRKEKFSIYFLPIWSVFDLLTLKSEFARALFSVFSSVFCLGDGFTENAWSRLGDCRFKDKGSWFLSLQTSNQDLALEVI